ncbi:MAG: alanine--glyoxylate aminotransferase family protein [Methanobacteriota archaeon]
MSGRLDLPDRILLGPGPSNVDPRVLRAMSSPLVGHLDPRFLEIMDETMELLRLIFQTKNRLTIPMSGTGSAGMETCLVNLIEPSDEVVVCINGLFGERMAEIASRCGGIVRRVEAEWGRIIEPWQVEKALQSASPKLVAVVHAETSTGILQPLEEISKLVHDSGALFLVDAVTSLGGCEVKVDGWGIDACYSATQKCLSCPPGLSPVTFSEKAMDAVRGRKSKVRSWYLDLSLIEKYWGEDRVYHHTAPVSMIYALHESLRIIAEEGLKKRFERHSSNAELLAENMASLGIELWAQEGYRAPMINAASIPEGIEDTRVRRLLLDKYNIEIGGGLGELAGKIWRIGLMGYSSQKKNVILLTRALKNILRRGK